MSQTLPIALELYKEHLLVTKALSLYTVEAYINDLIQLQSFCQKDILQIESSDIFKYLSTVENIYTRNRRLSSINSFFSFCQSNDFISYWEKIPSAKLPKALPVYLSHEEIMRGLKSIDRSKITGLRDYAFILFLYATGARVSEALMCKREDIKDEWLTIRYAKGEKERVVPIAKSALEALEEYHSHIDISSKWLWLNYKGDRLSRITAFKIVKKYLGVSPHTLRHSYASTLILGGADLRVVQELLGHSSLATTQIYTHIENSELKDTIYKYHPMSKNI